MVGILSLNTFLSSDLLTVPQDEGEQIVMDLQGLSTLATLEDQVAQSNIRNFVRYIFARSHR